jgi:hypothetical protein
MMKTFFSLLILSAAIHLVAQDNLLETLKSEHPRLLLNEQRVQEIKTLATEDTLLAEVIQIVHNYADSALLEPVIKYEFDQEGENNPRLKAQRRAAMFRVYNCGLTYLLTGDTVYAHRAKLDLLGAAAFPDWAPWHFLNVGEISAFMGIGYDWLYDYLTGEEKLIIERAIIRHGLIPGIKAYNGESGVERWWVDRQHNINQVCSGGMSLASLAIAEASPDTVSMILQGALSSVPNAMLGYLPDGAWHEGPTYWAYGTTYNGLMMAALKTSLDTVFQMDQGDGYEALGKSGAYHIHTAGPTNLYFNFGDSKRTLYYSPVLFWLAGEFNEPGYAWFERNIIVNDLPRMRKGGLMDDDTLDRFLALLAVWYSGAGKDLTNDDFPLDATFGGVDVALGAFHSEWRREAIYFGFKGGKAHASHSQMDIGSFVMDAKGERWAWDLGYGNNKQPGFSDYAGDRWTFYINTNLAHNTLSFWGMLQNKDAFIQVREFYSDPEWAFASLDMTESYKGIVRSCVRKYWFPERRSIEIIDEIDPAVGYMDVRWAMVTTAELSLHGDEALLRQNGKTCKVTILEPEGAVFEELSTRPTDPRPEETLNEGTTMLAANIYQEKTVPFTIKVAITPYDTTLSGGTTAEWESEKIEGPQLLEVFPNPASDRASVVFDLPDAQWITLSVFNQKGQLVSRIEEAYRPAGRNVVHCDLGDLKPGAYLLQLTHENGTDTSVLIRQ